MEGKAMPDGEARARVVRPKREVPSVSEKRTTDLLNLRCDFSNRWVPSVGIAPLAAIFLATAPVAVVPAVLGAIGAGIPAAIVIIGLIVVAGFAALVAAPIVITGLVVIAGLAGFPAFATLAARAGERATREAGKSELQA